MDVTAEYVRDILDYDQASGIFRWRSRSDVSAKWNARYAGAIAGNKDHRPQYRGRTTISINKQQYLAHRLAFLFVVGRWPNPEIDHINGEPGDNRWENLREVGRIQNLQNKRIQSNNKTGLKAVTWKSDKQKWRSVIQVNGRQKHLGYFARKENAALAYNFAAYEHYGEFARFS
jgi:hypothetical protein